MSGTGGCGSGGGHNAGGRASGKSIAVSRLGVLSSILQRKLVAVAGKLHIALMEGFKRRAMADRDDGGCRQFLLDQAIQCRLRGFIERGGGFIEEQILRRMQQRACEPKALLFAKREESGPVR